MKKDKNKVILKFTASSEPELISWLLSFGEEATLIKPGWLVKELKLKITKIKDCYK
jgi:predicted DNA-binding transcriptional regulator YafY